MGELTHRNLISQLDPENRRIAAPISDSIYLMKNVDCPAILVECGFLSNPDDAAKLKSGTYQTALATVIVGSYLGSTEKPEKVLEFIKFNPNCLKSDF